MALFSGEGKQPAFVIYRYHGAGTVPWNKHVTAQLEYVSDGVLRVQTEQGIWIAPPQRAVWILPGVNHTTHSSSAYHLCTLFIQPTLIDLPPKCGVVEIDPLMRELLLAAAKFGPEYDTGSEEDRLIHFILDRLPKKLLLPLHLPEPQDDRLQLLAQKLYNEPFNPLRLTALAHTVGMTARTAQRLFRKEMNMSFGKWRQQLRLIVALEKLAAGEKITNVALDVGYNSVPAFSTMFKKVFGITPKRYFRQDKKSGKQ